ncbi:MAG: hypothetical protein KY445_04905 [Armatimonadetes bacterium]|nr:hypothetical protein [Armatimonadota bacterium]
MQNTPQTAPMAPNPVLFAAPTRGLIELPEITTFRPRTVLVSPEHAAFMLEKYAYPGQRKLRPLEVARYARLMKMGRFNGHELRICILGDRRFITDGQHRLNAVVMSGIGQAFNLMEIVCVDESEVARDYNSNGGGIGRTQGDELRASGIEGRVEVGRGHFPSYVAAIKVINTEFAPPSKYLNSKDSKDLENGLLHYEQLHSLYADAAHGAHETLGKILRWAGVVAAGLATFEANKEQADVFWRALSSGDIRFPPVTELERTLLPMTGKRPSQLHAARIVAFYWARFNQKPLVKPTKRIFQDVNEPFFIYDSPKYTGKQQLNPAQLPAAEGK